METRKLYYEDPHCYRFRGRVLSCRQDAKGFRVILDATAFYPEGGGQAADTGTLGTVRVLDTREEGETVVHFCDGPLEEGSEAEGCIDIGPRFHRMQQHTGEHIVSGILHRRYGCHNTGFHMGAEGITIDFDTVIPAEDLPEIEEEANRTVWQNLQVRCFTPDPETLEKTVYRTKRALPWPVRIVQVPEIDSCACCGVHCASTGEVGLIKLFSSIPFRGGSRVLMACGGHALEILNEHYRQNKLVSQTFSAKPEQTGEAARKVNEQLAAQKFRITELERQIREDLAKSFEGKGNVLRFEEALESSAVRELADRIAEYCGGTAAVFSGKDGSGYSFCLMTRQGDLRELGRELAKALNGRGGGKSAFQQGSVQATKAQIQAFFADKL